jgi:hypothetical protein
VTFPTPGEDISLISSIFRDTLDYFFDEKKKVLDWGDLSRGQGGKRDEKGQKIFFFQFFSPYVWYVYNKINKTVR